MNNRNLILLLLPLVLLAGCSRSTLLTVDTNVLPFLAPGQLEGTIPVDSRTLLPHEDGLSSSELGIPADLQHLLKQFAVHLEVSLTATGASSEQTLIAAFHVAPEADGNLFGSEPLAEERIALAGAGGTANLELGFALSEADNPDAFELLRSGAFLLGLSLSHSAAEPGTEAFSVAYKLVEFNVIASTRSADLLKL